MTENFEVAHNAEGELSDETRHEVVAAQLRGEAKAAGQDAEAVVAAVEKELESLGLEPDKAQLQRRYEEIDPDVAPLADQVDEASPDDAAGAPADAPRDTPRESGADGPVTAGTDAGRPHDPVDDADPTLR